MQTKTILITINTSWNIVNFRRSLIAALQDQGYRVIAAAPEDAHSRALSELVSEYHPLPMQNDGTSPKHDVLLLWRYLKLFRITKPDVVLAYTIKPNVYGTLAAAICGIPTINNVSGLGTVFIKRNWLTKLACGLYRFAFHFSACVFFQNENDRQLFIQHHLVKARKTQVIPGSGIDLNYFTPVNKEPKAAGEACDFVLIARMLRDKGVEEYVEAARIVKIAHPQCRFRLVGPLGVSNKTAITQEEMDDWVSKGIVEYHGEADDIRRVIAEHDCVVLPSYREGMSRVLLESAAMGMPMVTTDAPGCRDVVRHGKNGFLCEVRSAKSLSEEILAFLALSTETKKSMGQKGRQMAETMFDQSIVHQAYLQTIAACLSETP